LKNYRLILCPTEFSIHCDAALDRAIELAGHYGARLLLLHVIDYFPEEIPNDWIAPEDRDPKHYLLEKAKTKLRQLARARNLDEAGLEVRFTDHSAKHEITLFARQAGADLIVLSSHARHGPFAMLGSTACGVVHTAPCDVMVIRAAATECQETES